MLPALPATAVPDTFVISCAEDKAMWATTSLPVYAAEFVLVGSIRQRLTLTEDRLKGACSY